MRVFSAKKLDFILYDQVLHCDISYDTELLLAFKTDFVHEYMKYIYLNVYNGFENLIF